MTFISYAQNFEDVMLWRALKHVKNGFYIDIGANDPVIDSVTKLFYENGWKGINVEPLLQHYEDLVHDRPRDVNLQCAVGEIEREIELWESDVRGWATANEKVIQKHMEEGHSGVFHKIPVRTLTSICDEYKVGDIHFMKIDVEGLEREVLQGCDFTRYRPWVVIVEATRPNSTEEVYCEWEHLLIQHEYQFAYADGLNRFYISKENSKLSQFFLYPPNVYDGFKIFLTQQAESKAQQAETKAQQAESKAQQAEITLQAIYSSRSWRVTRPLRAVGLTAFWLKNKAYRLTTAVKPWTFVWILRPLIKLIYTPAIINKVKKWSMKHPNIQMKLIGLRNRIINSPSLNEIVSNKHKNEITAHFLMQLVKSKLENSEQMGNVLYLTEPGENE